jgi:hypothetical protein
MTWNDQAPDPNAPRTDAPRITSHEQGVVRAFLQQRVPHFVEAHDTIHAIFADPSLPSAHHLVSHLIRDIINILPGAMLSGTKWDSLIHRPPSWNGLWFTLLDLVEKRDDVYHVDGLTTKAKSHLTTALTLSQRERKKPRSSELLIRSQLLPGELSEQVKIAINAIEEHRQFFIKNAHIYSDGDKHKERAAITQLHARFRSLETILASFFGGSLNALEFLNAWLERQDPTRLDEVLERAVTPGLASQFWDRLTNADLIEHLHTRGRFTTSARVELTADGTAAVLNSPSLRALARLTPANPAAAVKVWKATPITFESDLHQLISAAIASSGEAVRSLGTLATKAISGGLRPYIERDAFTLIGHLGKHAGGAIASNLLSAMLAIGKDESRSYDHLILKNCDPHDLRDKNVLESIKSLVLSDASAALGMFVDRLRESEAAGSSWYSLTSVEKDADNSDYDADVALVELFREVVGWAIAARAATPQFIAQQVVPSRSLIEKRLSVYLVGKYGSQGDADALMSNEALIDDVDVKNEVANLFKGRFAGASDPVKATVFAWIDRGPGGEDQQEIDHWRFCKLSWVRSSLSGDRLHQFNTLLATFGAEALTLADRSHHMEVGWGSTSPYSAGELTGLSLQDVVAKVSGWIPPGSRGFQSPTIGGLADAFGQAVAANAVTWSSDAMAIARMKPYFVSRALNGWLTYARDHHDLDWSSLMDLAEHILAQPDDRPTPPADQAGDPYLDHDWKWSRQNIADLIEKACDHGVSIALRPKFIGILSSLVGADPTSSILDAKDFFERDYASDGLNSFRGKVANALCSLVVWTAKADPAWKSTGGQFTGDLSRVQDALTLIEKHFADATSANSSTWASYALRSPQLRWISAEWYKATIADRVSPRKSTNEAFSPWAFWITFLQFHNAHRQWLAMHQVAYAETAVWIAEARSDQGQPPKFLGFYFRHLMVYYWQGDLDLADGQMIAVAFANASPSTRMQAMQFVGNALERGQAPPPEVRERFHRLWRWYWDKYGKEDMASRSAERHRQSLMEGWIASGHLGKEWSLTSFLDYLAHDAESEHGESVLKRLEAWAPAFPTMTLDATRLLVLGDRQGWRMSLWEAPIGRLLSATKASTDDRVIKARSNLREALVRRGHVQFGSEAP